MISLQSNFDDHCLAIFTEVVVSYQLTMESLERERERQCLTVTYLTNAAALNKLHLHSISMLTPTPSSGSPISSLCGMEVSCSGAKGSSFRAWSRSEYSHACFAYCQEFLPSIFYCPSPFTFIFLSCSWVLWMQKLRSPQS